MADAGGSWTDERVELLGRLWGEGLSASQIAAALGGGVTRNAVIGKVHRLGLAGRAKGSQPAATRPAKPRFAGPAGAPAGSAATVRAADGALVAEPAAGPGPFRPPATGPQEVALPVSTRMSILDLRDSNCRWPLGDPTSAEFGFCGARAVTGLPYCGHHCAVAYQPAADRKRIRV